MKQKQKLHHKASPPAQKKAFGKNNIQLNKSTQSIQMEGLFVNRL